MPLKSTYEAQVAATGSRSRDAGWEVEVVLVGLVESAYMNLSTMYEVVSPAFAAPNLPDSYHHLDTNKNTPTCTLGFRRSNLKRNAVDQTISECIEYERGPTWRSKKIKHV